MVTRALSFLLTLALVVPVVPLLGQGKPSDNKIYDQVRQKLANRIPKSRARTWT